MTKTIAILKTNLFWLALGLGAAAIAAAFRVWEWKAGSWGFGDPALGLLIIGMLVASWRLAHNNAAAELKLDLRDKLLIISAANVSVLAVVMVTTTSAIMALDIDQDHRGMLAILPLPFSGVLIIAALAAACVSRARA